MFLIQDMIHSGGLAKPAFIQGVGDLSPAAPRVAMGGASDYADGLRAVVFLATRPLGLSEVEILNRVPYLKRRETDRASGKHAGRECARTATGLIECS